MKIFYSKLNNTNNLNQQKKKEMQSQIGRLLTEKIAKTFYGIKDTSIIVENKKPKFKNANLCFNISHSNDIIAIAFDTMPLGLDIEYMKTRDFKSLSNRYNIQSDNKDTFYQFWTAYEAEIKIQAEVKQRLCFKLLPDYMLSLFSANPNNEITQELKIYKIKTIDNNFTLNEYSNLEFEPINIKEQD